MNVKVVDAHASGMFQSLKERLSVGAIGRLATLAGVAVVVSMATTFAAHAAAPVGQHSGSAYGTKGEIAAGPLAAQLGVTGYIGMPCLGTDGKKLSGDAVSPSVGLAGVTLFGHVVATSVQTSGNDRKSVDEVVSRLEGLKALNGLISASSIIAVSRTVAKGNSVTSDDQGTGFVKLKVADQVIPDDVPANTTIPLPGVGSVTLRRTTSSGDGVDSSSLSVDMIAIDVTTANTLGLPVGAKIVIGHADSGFKRGLPPVIYSGDAYVTLIGANVAGVASAGAGATAFQSLECEGTGGVTKTAKIATVGLDGVLATGAGATRIYGDRKSAKTNAKLERISLLGGLVTVKSIQAVAETKLVGNRRVRSTQGTTLGSLTVLGLPVPLITPGLTLDLPGIGTVTLNEQIVPDANSDKDTVVNAIKINITKNNLLGLPVGAKIIVGHASANVSKT